MATGAPTRQRGVTTNQPGVAVPGAGRLASTWGSIVDEAERAPNLKWPTSIDTFETMLNDAQVNALRQAVTLPIKRRRWMLDPNDADEQIVRHVADDLGLPIVGEDEQPKRVSTRRFSWVRHLHHVLLAPFYGHYFFAQFAPIEPDGLAHLRKLLPLPPRTLSDINVAQDGGLEWVRQWAGRRGVDGLAERIPVEALVAYVWEQEAGNWTGRSILRSVYRDWLAKDDLIRGNLIMHRRNGMGVPTAMQTERDADGSQLAAVQKIAQAWRVGEESSVGLPYGYDIKLKGVEGTLPDAVPSIKYHDEAMARSFLAMFLQLGQTERGARALGDTFVDFFALSLDAVAQDLVCDTATLHVIRDLVDWNYGEDTELVPLLVSERDEEPELSIGDMVSLIDAGALVVDDDLEDELRSKYRLPDRRTPEQGSLTARAVREDQPAAAASGRGRRRRPFGRAASRLRGRLRRAGSAATGRGLEPHEEHVDWEDLEARWTAARDALVNEWITVRDRQIEELQAAIEEADGDLAQLAALAIAASDDDAQVIAERLHELAEYGVSTARGEATAQGASLPSPDLAETVEQLDIRAAAVADLLSRAISEAAGRQAVQRSGGALAPAEVATEVAEHLRGLSNAYLEEQLGGALTQGMNTGRRVAMGGAPAGTRYFGSALLDTNVCDDCREDDGHEFESLADAELTYPVGGNKDCDGGVRCRCTIVAQYPESDASVE